MILKCITTLFYAIFFIIFVTNAIHILRLRMTKVKMDYLEVEKEVRRRNRTILISGLVLVILIALSFFTAFVLLKK